MNLSTPDNTQPARLAYRVPDLSAATGIPESTVWAAIKAGVLKARKHGRATLILSDDVHAYLAALPLREAPCSN